MGLLFFSFLFFFFIKVDAFLEAHDSGLTDADKRVADGKLSLFFVCAAGSHNKELEKLINAVNNSCKLFFKYRFIACRTFEIVITIINFHFLASPRVVLYV
jgi:hypothetical protein